MAKTDLQKQVDALQAQLHAMERRVVPHVCMTCEWLQLRTEPPRIRTCRFPGEIVLAEGRCVHWVQATDLWKRQPRNLTV